MDRDLAQAFNPPSCGEARFLFVPAMLASDDSLARIGTMSRSDKQDIREYLNWVIALEGTMKEAIQNEDPTNVWKYGGCKKFASKYAKILEVISANVQLPPILDRYSLEKIRAIKNTIACQQKEIFEDVLVNVALLRSILETKFGMVGTEIDALSDFFQARLRSAMFRPPSVEKEVQDAIEHLLIGRGLQKGQDYDRESWPR